MMDLYDETCFGCSKLITNKYSTSFSHGIKAFKKEYHYPIYGIYGFVRYADEIVDTFHNFNRQELFEQFRNDTFRAIEQKISLNPALHSFQLIVNKYSIAPDLIDSFLKSMEMDLNETLYTESDYRQYIYGSAEVVGLMCLHVFCYGQQGLYKKLEPNAKSLGAAFQKVNFLRDIKADFEERGRIYFPDVDFNEFTQNDKELIEKDIQHDFDHAISGIRQLPLPVRKGVYIAYVYYLELFKKIQQLPADTITNGRIRISDRRKIWLMARALVKHKLMQV